MKLLGKLIILLSVLGIAACGGGGGGGGATINTSNPSAPPVTFSSSFGTYVSTVNNYVSNLSGNASATDIANANDFISEFNSLKAFWDSKHASATTAQKLAWFYDEDYINARKIFHWLENEVLPVARDFADDGVFNDTNYTALNTRIDNGTYLNPYTETVEANRDDLCATQTVYRCSESSMETYITSYVDNTSTSSTESSGDSTTTTTSTTEDRVSTDANGNTVTKTFIIYTDTVTTPVTTTTVTTITRTNTWSDGSTTTQQISSTSSDSVTNTVSTSNREELSNTVITANIMSYVDTESSTSSSSNGDATTTTETTSTRTADTTDSSGNTITTTYTTYTDTTTTSVTTTVVTTTTRTYTWSNGNTTSEVIDTATTESTENVVTTSTREEATGVTSTANIVSYADSESTSSSESVGDATTTTETTSTRQTTETDDSGNTVVKTYTTYTDTTTTPVTTTTVVTTTRTYTWSDGSTTSEVIDTTSTDSTENTVTTSTREVLTDTTTTANIVSYSDSSTTSTTTTVSEPVLTNTTTNTDTREDGVYTFYYRTWTTTTTVVNTTTTVRTYTWSDGTTTTETLDPVVETTETTSDQVITEVVAPDETTDGGDAPTDNSGSNTVVQDNAPTLDFDPDTYVASTYYDSNLIGTPTEVSSHNPADHSTEEFDNNANMEVNANYAYARGWTGKGSVVMVMDTGIDTDHTEFEGKVKYTFDLGFDTPVEDENGHGTHVAGIIAANKDGVGMHGVAYDAELAVAKIGERFGVSLSGARQALEWAKDYDDIVVANLSANTNYSASYRDEITDHGNGIFTNNHEVYGGENYYNLANPQDWADVLPNELVLTVSAGNWGLDYVQNPAVFASAVDSNGNLILDGRMLVVGNWNSGEAMIEGNKSGHVCKDYSNGTCNDPYKTSDFYILAPGTGVYSTYNDGSYKTMSGTSMASPVVAGAVSIVHQLWPYMQGKNIAQVLLQTADKTISGYNVNTHGQGLLDLDKATRPVGDLGISLTGRTGTTTPLSGSISVNGLDSAELSSVSAVDTFDRDFTVDLSKSVTNKETLKYAYHRRGQSFATKFANLTEQQYGNLVHAGKNNDAFALGYKWNLTDNSKVGVVYSKGKTSPWIDMSGLYGEVTGSNTIDTNITFEEKGLWGQLGILNTKTDIKSGIVTDVSNVTSLYTVGGYDYENWSVYAGITPKVIDGSINLKVPTEVTTDGIMNYTNVESKIGTNTTPFVGFEHTLYFKENDTDISLKTEMVADDNGNHNLGLMFRWKF